MIRPPIFRGTVANGATQYVGVPVDGEFLYIDIQWKDATSAATITLESTGSDAQDAPVETAGTAWQWKTENPPSITGPAGAAAGSTKVNISNLAAGRARLKIVATANCDLEIYAWTKN